jgi:hypothetical protein
MIERKNWHIVGMEGENCRNTGSTKHEEIGSKRSMLNGTTTRWMKNSGIIMVFIE